MVANLRNIEALRQFNSNRTKSNYEFFRRCHFFIDWGYWVPATASNNSQPSVCRSPVLAFPLDASPPRILRAALNNLMSLQRCIIETFRWCKAEPNGSNGILKLHTEMRHTNYSATDNRTATLINQTPFFIASSCFMVFLIISLLHGKLNPLWEQPLVKLKPFVVCLTLFLTRNALRDVLLPS